MLELRRCLDELVPTGFVDIAHLELVVRNIDAGILEICRVDVVEDQVRVRLQAADRLAGRDRRRDFEVMRQVLTHVEHGRRCLVLDVRGRVQRRNLEAALLDFEHALIDRECARCGVIEIDAAQRQPLAARDVAGLRIDRCAGLILPELAVLLLDQAKFTFRFTVSVGVLTGIHSAGRIGTDRLGQVVKELVHMWRN